MSSSDSKQQSAGNLFNSVAIIGSGDVAKALAIAQYVLLQFHY